MLTTAFRLPSLDWSFQFTTEIERKSVAKRRIDDKSFIETLARSVYLAHSQLAELYPGPTNWLSLVVELPLLAHKRVDKKVQLT